MALNSLTGPLAIRVWRFAAEADWGVMSVQVGRWDLFARFTNEPPSWFWGLVSEFDGRSFEIDAGRFRLTLSRDPKVLGTQ